MGIYEAICTVFAAKTFIYKLIKLGQSKHTRMGLLRLFNKGLSYSAWGVKLKVPLDSGDSKSKECKGL